MGISKETLSEKKATKEYELATKIFGLIACITKPT